MLLLRAPVIIIRDGHSALHCRSFMSTHADTLILTCVAYGPWLYLLLTHVGKESLLSICEVSLEEGKQQREAQAFCNG